MDQIDLKILQLLQKRTKLSIQIGEAKHRHHAAVYVPERERELLARINRRSQGKALSAKAITAIYREILSSSRAAQKQAPVGYLAKSASVVIPPGRWCFGACDEFLPCKSWTDVAAGLASGQLAAALLTGAELAQALKKTKDRHEFLVHFTVVGDLHPALESQVPPDRRIFIVTPRDKGASGMANRALILIECKSTGDALKTLLHSMSDRPLHAELWCLQPASTPRGSGAALALMTFSQPLDGIRVTSALVTAFKGAELSGSILGVYPGTDTYGG